jgi:hypothetical protein
MRTRNILLRISRGPDRRHDGLFDLSVVVRAAASEFAIFSNLLYSAVGRLGAQKTEGLLVPLKSADLDRLAAVLAGAPRGQR